MLYVMAAGAVNEMTSVPHMSTIITLKVTVVLGTACRGVATADMVKATCVPFKSELLVKTEI
jgi:hypothetical protein